MKTLRIILILVCLLSGTILSGCCGCPTTCCRRSTCDTCSTPVTHFDHLNCQQP